MMPKRKSIVVVPTIREKCIKGFLSAWKQEFHESKVIVIEDNPCITFDLDCDNVDHLSWEDIERDLGTRSWIIPRRTDCIRSYGFWRAYQEKPDLIVTLDDDCYPCDPDFVAQHMARLYEGSDSAWVSTGRGVTPRGVPYYNSTRKAKCVLNHGLWSNVPDYDAPTQLVNSRHPGTFDPVLQTIPKGKYFPMCGMNIAMLPEVVPAFYFLLMGSQHEYDRFGDIWAGIILKRICDHLGYAINSGPPIVEHRRASDVWLNLGKEAPGLAVNEMLWLAVDSVLLTGGSFKACYREMAKGIAMDGEYWEKLKRAMYLWTELFP